MNRLTDKPRRFLPALVLALLALMAGVAVGSSSVRDWLVSGQASGAPTAQHKAEASAKKKNHGKRGPRGKRGPKGKTGPQGPAGTQGASGPQGVPGVSGDQVFDFSVNWQSQASDPGAGATTTALTVAGVGSLSVSCPWAYEAQDRSATMTFSPAADNSSTRGVAGYTVIQGSGTSASSYRRLESTSVNPIPIGYEESGRYALPSNGMITGTLSIEPFSGNGGASQPPATFTMYSEYKSNGSETERFCHISGQVISRVP